MNDPNALQFQYAKKVRQETLLEETTLTLTRTLTLTLTLTRTPSCGPSTTP